MPKYETRRFTRLSSESDVDERVPEGQTAIEKEHVRSDSSRRQKVPLKPNIGATIVCSGKVKSSQQIVTRNR